MNKSAFFGADLAPVFGRELGKHRVYGFGPELTVPLATKNPLFGFLNLRYFWGNRRPDIPTGQHSRGNPELCDPQYSIAMKLKATSFEATFNQN